MRSIAQVFWFGLTTSLGMSSSTIAAVLAVLAASAAPAVGAEPGPGAKPSPQPSSPARSSADTPFCPVQPSVTVIDGTKTRYAITLHGLETGLASGIVSLYAGNRRYDVRFKNVVVPDMADDKTPEAPVVVRFPAAVSLDGAAVTAIEENGMTTCSPVFSPWIASVDGAVNNDGRRTEELRARARAQVPIDAPTAVDDPVSCAVPYRAPQTTFAFKPGNPYPDAEGQAVIVVLLGPDDRILGTRVLKTAGNNIMDRVALAATARSRFEGSVFRCRHVFGAYTFVVSFTPQNHRF
ncbi:MAG: hypothetical protein JO036_15150 [Candidatus Eremiobacteraeota bacterium]|nr:hypothetical protein [Candidatus Eremiobacteraeota bacterium]